jgi:hypothetical protein
MQGSYEPDAVINRWKDKGWLLIDARDQTQKYHQVVIGITRPRVIAIRREAFQEVGCIPADRPGQSLQADAARAFLSAVNLISPCRNPTVRERAFRAIQEYLIDLTAGENAGEPGESPPACQPSAAANAAASPLTSVAGQRS